MPAFWLSQDLSAIVRLILGGELTEYTEMMGRARSIATARMTAQAAEMGADAVINVRYMTTSVVGSAAELLVYGTAVRIVSDGIHIRPVAERRVVVQRPVPRTPLRVDGANVGHDEPGLPLGRRSVN